MQCRNVLRGKQLVKKEEKSLLQDQQREYLVIDQILGTQACTQMATLQNVNSVGSTIDEQSVQNNPVWIAATSKKIGLLTYNESVMNKRQAQVMAKSLMAKKLQKHKEMAQQGSCSAGNRTHQYMVIHSPRNLVPPLIGRKHQVVDVNLLESDRTAVLQAKKIGLVAKPTKY